VYSCEGFWAVPVLPSPKSHTQDVGEPVDSSVNSTVRGAVPSRDDAVNAAVGAEEVTVIFWVVTLVLLPAEFVAVRETV